MTKTKNQPIGRHTARLLAEQNESLRAELAALREGMQGMTHIVHGLDAEVVAAKRELTEARARATRPPMNDADRCDRPWDECDDVLAELAALRERMANEAHTHGAQARRFIEMVNERERDLATARALADRLGEALAGVQHGSCDGCDNVQNDRYCPECKEERFDYDGDPLPGGGWPDKQPNHLETCATGAALKAWKEAREARSCVDP